MANYCEVCGKGKMSGNNVSHSHHKTRRIWQPNIQRVHAVVDGKPCNAACVHALSA